MGIWSRIHTCIHAHTDTDRQRHTRSHPQVRKQEEAEEEKQVLSEIRGMQRTLSKVQPGTARSGQLDRGEGLDIPGKHDKNRMKRRTWQPLASQQVSEQTFTVLRSTFEVARARKDEEGKKDVLSRIAPGSVSTSLPAHNCACFDVVCLPHSPDLSSQDVEGRSSFIPCMYMYLHTNIWRARGRMGGDASS